LAGFKLAGLSLWPVGRRVVTIEMVRQVREENSKLKVAKH